VEAPSSDENDFKDPAKVFKETRVLENRGVIMVHTIQAEGRVEKSKMVGSQVEAKLAAKPPLDPPDSKPTSKNKFGSALDETMAKATEQNLKTEDTGPRPAAQTGEVCSGSTDAGESDSESAARGLQANLAAMEAAKEAAKGDESGSIDLGPRNSESCNGRDNGAKTFDTSRNRFRHRSPQCASIAGAAGAIFCAIAWSYLVEHIY